MKERITISVNNMPINIHRGMTVKHALIAHDQALYTAAMKGDIILVDDNGFQIGLEGALQDGAKIFTRHKFR
jgi:hypothetical protein